MRLPNDVLAEIGDLYREDDALADQGLHGGGPEIFAEDDPEYLAFLRTRADPDDGA
ncbi:hypothetical protein AB0C76_27265 [Kitasatospora sp. NPDC048722]|uniref:hypothetical protein n=1 Tax=Kitasatospora sp. NPDC048722 TaxID=3155639 RepID=UPI0033F15357